MNNSAKTWVRSIVSTTGAVVAGPAGAIVGSLFGSLLTSVIPGVGSFAGDVARALCGYAEEHEKLPDARQCTRRGEG